jgi:hypothetical protein
VAGGRAGLVRLLASLPAAGGLLTAANRSKSTTLLAREGSGLSDPTGETALVYLIAIIILSDGHGYSLAVEGLAVTRWPGTSLRRTVATAETLRHF